MSREKVGDDALSTCMARVSCIFNYFVSCSGQSVSPFPVILRARLYEWKVSLKDGAEERTHRRPSLAQGLDTQDMESSTGHSSGRRVVGESLVSGPFDLVGLGFGPVLCRTVFEYGWCWCLLSETFTEEGSPGVCGPLGNSTITPPAEDRKSSKIFSGSLLWPPNRG